MQEEPKYQGVLEVIEKVADASGIPDSVYEAARASSAWHHWAASRIEELKDQVKSLELLCSNYLSSATKVFKVGSEVTILEPGIKAKVDAVIIEDIGITYQLYWWNGASRNRIVLPPCKISPIGEQPLPELIWLLTPSEITSGPAVSQP